MAEEHIERVHIENIVLDIGREIGALVIYTGEELRGKEIEVSLKGSDAKRTHTAVHERRFNGRTIFAGVFPTLPAGEYKIWWHEPQPAHEVTITGGHVAEVDWR